MEVVMQASFETMNSRVLESIAIKINADMRANLMFHLMVMGYEYLQMGSAMRVNFTRANWAVTVRGRFPMVATMRVCFEKMRSVEGFLSYQMATVLRASS